MQPPGRGVGERGRHPVDVVEHGVVEVGRDDADTQPAQLPVAVRRSEQDTASACRPRSPGSPAGPCERSPPCRTSSRRSRPGRPRSRPGRGVPAAPPRPWRRSAGLSGLEYCSGQKVAWPAAASSARTSATRFSRAVWNPPGPAPAAAGTRSTTAPRSVSLRCSRASTTGSLTRISRRSRCTACMASASPNVPEVVSTITVPGSSIPRSAARHRMYRAGIIFMREKHTP